MIPYIGFVWDPTNIEAARNARKMAKALRGLAPIWTFNVETEGLIVACSPSSSIEAFQSYLLPNQKGVVIGRLFDKGYPGGEAPRSIKFDNDSADELINSSGQQLIDLYWGAYVAFIRHPNNHDSWVIRDPTGMYPCYVTRSGEVDVYFLRLEDLNFLGKLQLTLNRGFLLSSLAFKKMGCDETGIEQINMVLPGQSMVRNGPRRSSRILWDPLKIILDRPPIHDTQTALQLLRQTVRASVHAWASCFNTVLQTLSGGVDSAIVLSCLTDAPNRPQILGVNYYGDSAASDERVFARHAAQSAGIKLFELKSPTQISLEPLRSLPRSPQPYLWMTAVASLEENRRIISDNRVDAIFNGHGGDEVFFSYGAVPAASDYLHYHRSIRGLFSVALDDVAVEHRSLAWVLGKTIRHGLFKLPWSVKEAHQSFDQPLIPAAVREEAYRECQFVHPLYRGSTKVPAGKLHHAYQMTRHTDRIYNPCLPPEYPAEISPLISQPLIELCLQIPLSVLRAGGRTRALARTAFKAAIPSAIYHRTTKGTGDTDLKAIIKNNQSLVEELLLDGFLTKMGLLDRSELGKFLCGHPTQKTVYVADVLDCLGVECWIRACLSNSVESGLMTRPANAYRYG